MEWWILLTLSLVGFSMGWFCRDMLLEFRGHYDAQEMRSFRDDAERYAIKASSLSRDLAQAKRELAEAKHDRDVAQARLGSYRNAFGEVMSLEGRYAG